MKKLSVIAGMFLLILFISSCKKATDNSISIKDGDNNIYTSVTIGTQVWMVENLKTTKYNDGELIPLVTDSATWVNQTTAGYCWYLNTASYKAPYGALYNSYAVRTGKLCPTGWHVPSDVEWTTLTTYLGGDSIAARKLKETGTTHWLTPNTGATNESNFTALPGGYRSNIGVFSGLENYGYWWSSTDISGVSSWNRTMSFANYSVSRNPSFVQDGFTVRCLKD